MLTKWYQLPFNPELKEKAKELRKAGNLSEVLFWNQVKNKKFLDLDFDRQKIIGNYIVDFYCKDLGVVIEIDGSSHDEKMEYDSKRDKYFESLGLTVIHLLDRDIKTNLEGVMEFLEKELTPLHPSTRGETPLHPSTRGEWEGKIRSLLSYADEIPDLSEAEKDAIIDALDRVKIIDPACGSGAFPMGILHKMLLILQKIDPESKKWVEKKLLRIDNKLLRQEMGAELKRKNWDYIHKLGIIQNSIYGVDIQTIAIEISKLRFFLSLIVDEKIDDVKPNRGVVPLPNLEFKFVAANSLIGLPKAEGGLAESHTDIEKLRELRDAYFTAYGDEKRRIEREFKETQDRMFMHALNWQATGSQTYKLSEWNPFEDEASSWFDPEWMFGANGFDIVIANPPYVRHESIKEFKPRLAGEFGGFYCGTADLYTYFYKKGIDLLRKGGHLCFIAPNKFMRAGYGKNTRILLTTEVTPQVVIDFCDLPIFDATTYPSVLLVEKRRPKDKDKALAATFVTEEQLNRLEETLSSIGFRMPVASLRPEGWNLEQPEVLALMEKLKKAGKPLGEYVQGRFYRGVLTGLNEAFVIDAETRKRLIAEDHKSEELIKPWLRGRDIKKWKAEWAGLYVIFTRRGIDIDKYPAVKHHLEQFREDLEPKNSEKQKRGRKPGTYQWYEIQDNIAYYKEFEEPKIVYPDIAQSPEFTWDVSGSFLGNTAYIIPTKEKWLLGLLNSRLLYWFYLNISSTIRGGFVRFIAQYMEQLPIPSTTDKQKAPIIERVEKILADPDGAEVPRLEAEIDEMIYELYGLTEDEIKIIENK